jgi:hypothetical protein
MKISHPTHNSEDTIIYELHSWEVQEVLKYRGIVWDRIVQLQDTVTYCGIERPNNYVGPIYFMLGNCDVAYYCRDMESLYIHGKARVWGQSVMDFFKVIG